MQMPKNHFKRALAAGEFQVGAFLGLIDPCCAEIMASAGFDWLMVDGEHGANDPRSVLAQLQAMAPYPVKLVVRTVDHDAARIKQYLDVGVQSLLVPMVESAEQARALVRAIRYPPSGIRGVGTALARAARWNGVEGYFDQADAEMCLIVQIESRAGLEAIDEILAEEGVDAVFVGPSDLAASLGHLGNPGHPEVSAAVSDALSRIAAAGKAAGVFSADPAAAERYRQAGASFVAAGVDTLLLRNAAVQLAGRFKTADAPRAGAAY
ncbi:2-keto-3-deoxy-L-rhamnonate aldolase [Parazoarcus communis]|uniref:2-keto-3-deoxy-L-rhamnonate aldolase n=1 Tax=Parazoarcus communis TaxID=41977 RepID=A0A2U8GT67_9RHOO|nr:HpcH/HpaI aldolase/citrate lyase family protein [Parazoarcus communis]AWI76604.1 2-keto-3-deoxy-L-rhamnonate aldolase [Parazoarcus communis]